MSDMFCFQCEQTVGGKACTGKKGTCGKMADTSNLQDEWAAQAATADHSADR